MEPSRSSRTDLRFTIGIVLIAVLLWVGIGSNVIGMAYERDFLNLYTGGLLVRTGHLSDLYNFEVQAATQDRLVPGLKLHFPFVRPPFYALLLAPLSLLPVKVAFPVWILAQILGMLLVWAWAWRRFGPDSLVYCAFFLPTSLGIAHGQDCIVLLLMMLAAWNFIENGRDRAAGLTLALTLFKFHLFLLLPIAMLLRKRWTMLTAYAAGGAALALASFFLVGPAGVQGYIDLLTRRDIQTLSPSPEMMVGWNSIAVNAGSLVSGLDSVWFKGLLSALAVGIVGWSALKVQEDARWFWTAILGSMMLSPHTYEYDVASLIIPASMAVFTANDRVLRMAALAALIPLPYFFTIAGTPWAIVPSVVVAAFFLMLSGVVPARMALAIQQPIPASGA